MNDHDGKQKSQAELECEIRQGRTFSPQEAIARMAGPGAMKGASPVSPVQQAETEIMCWLGAQLRDATGALPTVLHRQIRGSELLLANLHQPLVAVAGYCRNVLGSDYLLKELVREADVEWGRVMAERPYFDRASPPHPDDPYTAESVRLALSDIVKRLVNTT